MEAIIKGYDLLEFLFKKRVDSSFTDLNKLKGIKKRLSEFVEYDSVFAKIINTEKEHNNKIELAAILLLAAIPHVEVGFFERIITELELSDRVLVSTGLVKGHSYPALLPTLETALYVLGGNDLKKRIEVLRYFDEDSILSELNIVSLNKPQNGEPLNASRLDMNPDFVELFLRGYTTPPSHSIGFPAQRLETDLKWKDLILPNEVETKINHLKKWLQYQTKLQELGTFSKHLKGGFKALFTGPPGTGKTLTASLFGKLDTVSGEVINRSVYRIDLSMVVSKFIGETEKNLSQIFDKARDRDWVLLFDEADALFGKRTSVRDAHDRYANQQIAYLLQRIEDHPGLVILTSNLSGNIDPAFYRRFDIVVSFPIPGPKERLKIWKNALNGEEEKTSIQLAEKVDLNTLAKDYEISGAAIINAIKYAIIESFGEKGQSSIQQSVLIEGIKRELRKDGIVI